MASAAAGDEHPIVAGAADLAQQDARSATRLTPDPAAVVEQPTRGWRAVIYGGSGGRWNPGLSRAEKAHRAGLQRIATPLLAPHTVAVVSLKGGVGRTTLAALLSLYLADHRGDRVVAVDANPDVGTLGDRLLAEPATRTLSDLVNHLDEARADPDFTHRWLEHVDRLAVLPAVAEPSPTVRPPATTCRPS